MLIHNKNIREVINVKKILVFLFAVMVIFGIAACQGPTDNTTPTTPDGTPTEPAATDNTPEPVATIGSASVDATFSPEVGKYQSTAAGKIDLKAELKGAKAEIYTKSEGTKKVVASVDLGDITENKVLDMELIVSKPRVTYTIGDKAGSEENILQAYANQVFIKHTVGVDIVSDGSVKANWESSAFVFDDDDAFKAVAAN